MENHADVGKGQFKRTILAQSLALALGTTLLGSAPPALAAAPLVVSYNPPDDSGDFVVRNNLVLKFDQTVSAVAGKNIVIRKSADNSVVETIAASDTPRVTFVGSTALINPSADLAYSTAYYVQIDAGAFVNSGGEAYAGIANTTSWNFTTRSAAAVTAYTPANGSTGVVPAADLSMSFNECVTPVASKNIVIKKFAGNSVVETIAVNDTAKVTLSCSKQSGTAVINPANDLLFNTGYVVQIDAGAFIGDTSGASYAGILDNSTWAFTTVPDTTAPTVPAGLSATAVGAAQANLLWTASTDNGGVTAYKVYRNNFLVATRGDVTNYSDTGLTASTAYSYTVAACDAAGNCSSQSTPASATTAAAPPPSDTQAPTVPTGLTAAGTSSTSAIYLSWTSSTDNVGVTAYKIYRDQSPLVALGKVTRYTDTGLSASTAYSYSVAACDGAGNCSAQSPVVSATTKAPPRRIAATTEVVAVTNPNVTVDSDGALVVTSNPNEPTTVVLKCDGVLNVDVKLAPGQPVIFSSSGTCSANGTFAATATTHVITDVSGQSQFLTTSIGGVTQIELVKGQMQVDADKSGTAIPVTSTNSQSTNTLVTSADGTTVAVVKDETTATVFVDSGKVGQAAGNNPPVAVYQGENSTVDPGGNLTQLALGSQNGTKQVPGDPLPVGIPKDSNTKIPNLEGTLPRLNNTVSLLDLVGEVIRDAVGNSSGQLSYDKATGVITYTLGNLTIRLVALGDVLVQLNQFAAGNVSATAGGAYSLASRGIQMSLSGALGYFSDLQSVVKATDSNGQLSLKSTGAIEIRAGGGHYVVMPALIANLPSNPNPLPGFESDASGYAVFRDRLGALQTLYPTFLDTDSLYVAFATLAPSLSLTNNGNGTVTANFAGQSLTLRPDYTIIDRPVGHESDPYWQDNGTVYFHNSDQSAQGFGLQ
jgi:chitodextrinase